MKKSYGTLNNRRIKSSLEMFMGRPDLTPLVDVFFILLLFFMFSSSFIQIFGVQIDLPKADGSYSSGNLERYIITVSWAPEGILLYFNDQPITMDNLKAELAELGLRSRNAQLLLYCDRRVSSGDSLEILSLTRKANLPVIYATKPKGNVEQTILE